MNIKQWIANWFARKIHVEHIITISDTSEHRITPQQAADVVTYIVFTHKEKPRMEQAKIEVYN